MIPLSSPGTPSVRLDRPVKAIRQVSARAYNRSQLLT